MIYLVRSSFECGCVWLIGTSNLPSSSHNEQSKRASIAASQVHVPRLMLPPSPESQTLVPAYRAPSPCPLIADENIAGACCYTRGRLSQSLPVRTHRDSIAAWLCRYG